MKIGPKLKSLRLNKELTQENVANILNVSRQTISSWELSKSYPDLDNLVSLSDLYNVSLDTLLKEDKDMIEKISKDSKIVSNLIKKRKVIGICFFIIIFIIGSVSFINYNKKLDVKIEAINSNYNIKVKGSDKYYKLNKTEFNKKNTYEKFLELNNFNSSIKINNSVNDKIYDLKVLDSNENVIEESKGLAPGHSYEMELKEGKKNYIIYLKEYDF